MAEIATHIISDHSTLISSLFTILKVFSVGDSPYRLIYHQRVVVQSHLLGHFQLTSQHLVCR